MDMLTGIRFLEEPAVIVPSVVNLTDSDDSIVDVSFLTSEEEGLLSHWITEIVQLNNTWSLVRGRFYYSVHKLLKNDTVKSQVYGNFASLCENLRKNYRMPGASRGYELKRAYEQYLHIVKLGVEFPPNCRLTAELFLALEKIPENADDLRLEAAQWCVDEFSRRNGIVDVPDLIKTLEGMQERYPEREVLKTRLRANGKKNPPNQEGDSADSQKSLADWNELESLAQIQNRRIREQQSLLDEMLAAHRQMEQQLADVSSERDRLLSRNIELERLVAALQNDLAAAQTSFASHPFRKLSTFDYSENHQENINRDANFLKIDAEIALNDVDLEKQWEPPSLIQSLLERKRKEGLDLDVKPEWGDWTVYEQERVLGGVEEGQVEELERIINRLLPKPITQLLETARLMGFEIACVADDTGCYNLTLPNTPEQPFSYAAQVVHAINQHIEAHSNSVIDDLVLSLIACQTSDDVSAIAADALPILFNAAKRQILVDRRIQPNQLEHFRKIDPSASGRRVTVKGRGVATLLTPLASDRGVPMWRVQLRDNTEIEVAIPDFQFCRS